MVDSVTAGLARDLVQFEELGTISLKGKAVQAEVYTPIGPAAASVRAVHLRNAKIRESVSRSSTQQKNTFSDKVKGDRCHPGSLAIQPDIHQAPAKSLYAKFEN